MTYGIGIYVIIVIVASEQMQKIFLIWSHYILGLTLVLFLLNVFVFWETIYFWVLEVEFDEHRNQRANHTFDLASWEMIQTMPLAFYLGLCYLFLSDARAHYKTQDGAISELVLSIYIALTTTTIASWNTWLQDLMVYSYGVIYTLLFQYLNPVYWLEWSFLRITELVTWIRQYLPQN